MWRVVIICVALTGILVAAESAMLAGRSQAYNEPFAPYEAIMPGQPLSALNQYPCDIQNGATGYCNFEVNDGPFASINIMYGKTIERIGFKVRPGGLYVGDFLHCWGKPLDVVTTDVSSNASGLLNINWGNQRIVVIDSARYGAKLGNSLVPISYISLGSQGHACQPSQQSK